MSTMRTRRTFGHATAAVVTAIAVVAGGCGVEPSDVEDGGEAPTGLAEGTTLYFVDAEGQLQPSIRETGRLGSIGGAVQLLISGISRTEQAAGLHSDVPVVTTGPVVEDAGNYVTIRLPYASAETTRTGIDQVICTAAAVVASSGRPTDSVEISVRLTSGEDFDHACPVVG
ncbi:hypothetical protein [Haloactinopolyspora sp.]|uniref:hypothetical protein n=1 Tax=Haloactinopolyspora sp. TaxID=1966353 RepID=UPI00260FCF5D|nr:hypothetical protein [Haloactinopolyspora sp.]